MPSLAKTLRRWYWTVCALMNSLVPISGLDRPSLASRATSSSCALSSSWPPAELRLRVAAAKIAVGTMAVAITNAAADTLARSLALELAPIRVNAISTPE